MGKQGMIYTRRLIAQVLKITEKRVKQLTDEGVIPEISLGHYKLLPAVQGYIGYLQSQISDDDLASDYNVEKARLTRTKRELAELDLQLERNKLHRADSVEFVLTNMLMALKAKISTLPHKVLPAIMGLPDDDSRAEQILAILKDAATNALEELAEYDPKEYGATNHNNVVAVDEEDSP